MDEPQLLKGLRYPSPSQIRPQKDSYRCKIRPQKEYDNQCEEFYLID